jgi:hypothetical protein
VRARPSPRHEEVVGAPPAGRLEQAAVLQRYHAALVVHGVLALSEPSSPKPDDPPPAPPGGSGPSPGFRAELAELEARSWRPGEGAVPPAEFAAFCAALAAQYDAHPLAKARYRARSHCRFAPPLNHFKPDSLTYSVRTQRTSRASAPDP